MGQYIRKTIYITVEQDQFLKRRAAERGISVSAVIREILDEVFERGSSDDS
jgi:hypothetical protein